MQKSISEKVYPISRLWVIKAPTIFTITSVGTLLTGFYWLPLLVLAIPLYLIYNSLARRNFHFSLEDNLFVIREGVLSKRHRSIHYGSIQNVLVKQDLFDRIFGISSLRIENASQSGGAGNAKDLKLLTSPGGSRGVANIGSSGNSVSIPGLKKSHAEELKNYILQKIKDNPTRETHSGL